MRPVLTSLALALSLLAAAGCGASSNGGEARKAQAAVQPSTFRGTAIPGKPLRAPDFTLRDQDGRLVRLSSLRGRYVVVSFLYTHCPDVCPVIADNLNRALHRLGAKRDDVRMLAVSVDPTGDRPASVHRFVRAHRLLPQFRYLTGTRKQLQPIWKAYHLVVQPGTTVMHSAFEVLVDKQGNERLLYDAQVKAADVVHDLRALEG
jgi:protein SCO1/2